MIEEKKKNNLVQEAKSITFIVIIALLIRVLVIEPFFIPSPSMYNTLLEGDYIFSTKYSYGYSKHSLLFLAPDSLSGRIVAKQPERGDIIIFRPPHNMDTRYIKRLIGIPGDKVQVINSTVYVNDKPLDRRYIKTIIGEDGANYKQYIETSVDGMDYEVLQKECSKDALACRGDNTKLFYVPDGNYFFMGDNRNNSNDSRADLGYVPFENFIAKAQFIYFSAAKYLWIPGASIKDQFTQVYHWIASIRGDRMLKSVYDIDKLKQEYNDSSKESKAATN